MTATLIGYARCSTDEQDLTAQRQLLLGLGVAPDRIYLDHGLTGTNRPEPAGSSWRRSSARKRRASARKSEAGSVISCPRDPSRDRASHRAGRARGRCERAGGQNSVPLHRRPARH